jgi:hypothetical protein
VASNVMSVSDDVMKALADLASAFDIRQYKGTFGTVHQWHETESSARALAKFGSDRNPPTFHEAYAMYLKVNNDTINNLIDRVGRLVNALAGTSTVAGAIRAAYVRAKTDADGGAADLNAAVQSITVKIDSFVNPAAVEASPGAQK